MVVGAGRRASVDPVTIEPNRVGHADPANETWATWANAATAVRLVVGLVVFAYAAVTRDETWNFIGLGVYWMLDVVDGFLARRFDQETRIGAQMDILADRVLVAYAANWKADDKRLVKARELVHRWRDRPLFLVFLSATIGLPPFYVVSIVAGIVELRFRAFVVVGFAGRTIRFATIAVIAALV